MNFFKLEDKNCEIKNNGTKIVDFEIAELKINESELRIENYIMTKSAI